jgi:uracil-DNA glycosylase
VDKQAEIARLYEGYAKTAVLQPVAAGRRLVPGYGPLNAPMVVVGEAPGAAEDSQGRPFVGASGQRLQRLFREAYGKESRAWEACYVMNVLPWRPPGNRTPYAFEVIASCDRVAAEIAVIGPLIVVAAGATAWRAVTRGEHGRFSEARGKLLSLPGVPWGLIPVFHPSAILRAGDAEGQLMEDDTVRALRLALGESDAAGAA